MELKKYYGLSGRIYFVHHSDKTHWNVWIEGPHGLEKVEAKAAAIDCGAELEKVIAAKGGRETITTHDHWWYLTRHSVAQLNT